MSYDENFIAVEMTDLSEPLPSIEEGIEEDIEEGIEEGIEKGIEKTDESLAALMAMLDNDYKADDPTPELMQAEIKSKAEQYSQFTVEGSAEPIPFTIEDLERYQENLPCHIMFALLNLTSQDGWTIGHVFARYPGIKHSNGLASHERFALTHYPQACPESMKTLEVVNDSAMASYLVLLRELLNSYFCATRILTLLRMPCPASEFNMGMLIVGHHEIDVVGQYLDLLILLLSPKQNSVKHLAGPSDENSIEDLADNISRLLEKNFQAHSNPHFYSQLTMRFDLTNATKCKYFRLLLRLFDKGVSNDMIMTLLSKQDFDGVEPEIRNSRKIMRACLYNRITKLSPYPSVDGYDVTRRQY